MIYMLISADHEIRSTKIWLADFTDSCQCIDLAQNSQKIEQISRGSDRKNRTQKKLRKILVDLIGKTTELTNGMHIKAWARALGQTRRCHLEIHGGVSRQGRGPSEATGYRHGRQHPHSELLLSFKSGGACLGRERSNLPRSQRVPG